VSESFVKLMAATKTPEASTLTIGEGYSRLVEHPEFLDQPLYRAVYEPETITRLRTTVRDEYAKRAWTTWMKVMTPVAQENLRQIHAAIFLGKERDLGSIEEGKLADLVLLAADPTRDIRNAEQIEMVIKGGVVTDRGALDLPVNRHAP
jgi:hypothetical protein